MQGIKSDNPVVAGLTITVALTAKEREDYIRMAKLLGKKNSALGREIIVPVVEKFFAEREQNFVQITEDK